MQHEVPKQFLPLVGKPILMHTIQKFAHYDSQINIIVVLPSNEIETWKNLCAQHGFTIPHTICEGGPERFHSVKNGLDKITDGVVAIHDGVRPLVSETTINSAYKKAEISGNAIPVIEVEESYRRRIDGGNKYINRKGLCVVQTPQCFQASLIKDAYNTAFDNKFTDDASVLEAKGHSINLVDGTPENIKITTPATLKMAEALFT